MLILRLLIASCVCSWPAFSAYASTVTRTYTALGQVASIDGARTDVSDITQYSYDAQGHLTTVTFLN
ncbi:RHS repeat domain-containing protein [Pseudomonas sp. NPDC089734]|uniref:RHS repeat domain-containing protein n=1 Tax=Pseudomonas sp. NPDC089734 TaxID=3364469 RepID=UPI00380918A8